MARTATGMEPIQRQPRVGSLEVEQDLDWERGEWIAERIAWSLMAVVIALGLAGAFGTGPVGNVTVDQPPLKLTGQRILRAHSPETLMVRSTTKGDTLEIRVSSSKAEDFEVSSVTPGPLEERSEGDSTVYVIAKEGDTRADVMIEYRVMKPGVTALSVSAGEETVRLRQLVLP